MELVSPQAELYAAYISSPLDTLLQELYDHTLSQHKHAHLLSGAVQGKFLEFFSRAVSPTKILEVGTFTGFSALCLAKGLKPEGELHTIEIRDEDANIASSYFNRSLYASQIKLHLGNAIEIIPLLDHSWDLVFIDADKVNYIQYYELTLQQLKPGGWIIADNVLFHGQVLEDEVKGKNALAIHHFNEHVKKDDRVEQALISLRDGLLFIKKKHHTQ
ncbi:MAG: O-methyltransferase [Ferruginibacter sp.]